MRTVFIRFLAILIWVCIYQTTCGKILSDRERPTRKFSSMSRSAIKTSRTASRGEERRLSGSTGVKDEKEEDAIMTAHIDYPMLGLVNIGSGEYDFEIK